MRSGRAALLVLALLLVGGVGALVTSPRARMRWYVLRMRSSDPEVAAHTRFKLFELDRPAIDPVLPELVAKELAARLEDERSWVVMLGTANRDGYIGYQCVQPKDPVAKLLAERIRGKLVIYLDWAGVVFSVEPPPPIAIPLDGDVAVEILRAVRAELGARAP